MKYLIFLLAIISCSQTPIPAKNTLILIQGFHLDSSSWKEVEKLIPEDKYLVKTLNRLGRDEKRPASLNRIANISCKEIPLKSVLVAHSFGGAIATGMYGKCPEKIVKIIYISALVPKSDEMPFARMTNKAAQAQYAKAVKVINNKMVPHSPKIFFGAMDPMVDVKSTTLPPLYAESATLTSESIHYNPRQFAALPKSFILTLKDPVVTQETQKMFLNDANIKEFQGIPTGHYPMIANPKLTAEMILKYAPL